MSKQKVEQKRRLFLKKAVYHTPTFYILGSLVKPVDIFADSSGGPPGPPGNGLGFGNGKAVPARRKTLRF